MDHSALETILVFLVAGIAGIVGAKCLRISPILGFFAAGAVVGPYGLAVLPISGTFEVLAELGVAFLLFDVGTHLSFGRLWHSRRDLFGLGGAQVALTTAVLAAVLWSFGIELGIAVLIGAALALSSTALVLQALKDRDEHGSPLHEKAISLLVFQDLFVVLLLVLLPAFAGTGEASVAGAIGLAVGKVLLAVLAVTAFGRLLLQPVFRWITGAQNDELFTFSALAFVIAIAFGANALGLSLPLGAFLAGLALAESRYSYVVRTEVAPFRGLLMSLFFLSVGMKLQLDVFVEQPLTIAGATVGVILAKALVLWGVGRSFGLENGFAWRFGLTMSQASEFAFVLIALATTHALVSVDAAAIVAATVGVTLALTPLLVKLGAAIGVAIDRSAPEPAAEPNHDGKVVIVGFDDTASKLARILVKAEIDYVAFTSDREAVSSARCQGFAVEYGSPDRPRALGMASVGQAACVVIIGRKPVPVMAIVTAIKATNDELPVYAATDDAAVFEQLSREGLRDALMLTDNTAFEVGRGILSCVGWTPVKTEALIEQVRVELDSTELVPALT